MSHAHRSAAVVLFLLPAFAAAATRTWPTTAPCNGGTLQACLDGAASGDIVEVATDATIDENLGFSVPLRLRAASGYLPRLAPDRSIAVNAGVDGTYAVEGFTLQRGSVNVAHYDGDVHVRIRRVRVLATPTSGSAQISLYSPAATPLDYDIGENQLSYAWDTYDGAIRAALQVLDSQSGSSTGRIHENRIDAGGQWSSGILVVSGDQTHVVRIDGNWIRGGHAYGSIDVRHGAVGASGGGSLTAYVVNNVVTPLRAPTDAFGIRAEAYFGSLALQAFNNTVTGASRGVSVEVGSGATISGRIANNLLAGNILNLAYSNGGSGSISNDHNLLYDGAISGFTPGAGTINADPLLRGAPGNPWLNAGSPAIDAADSTSLANLLVAAGLARIDGAGLRRFKGLADIGALEYGDATFLHRTHDASPGIYSLLAHPAVDAQPQRRPHVTSNWNPPGTLGLYWNHPVGALYDDVSSRWLLRAEDLVPFADDARFNIFAPATGEGSFAHVATAANVSGAGTQLSASGLNDQPDRVLLVTRDSLDPGNSIYDDVHPFGVFYFSFGGPGSWFIAHFDSIDMNAGGGYHVYWQPPSANAFRHIAMPGNISNNYTLLDHPLLNGHACAQVHVTQGAGGGVLNGHHVGVWYTGSRWAIYNQDLASMPIGAEFHVVVDARQVVECNDVIFAGAFD